MIEIGHQDGEAVAGQFPAEIAEMFLQPPPFMGDDYAWPGAWRCWMAEIGLHLGLIRPIKGVQGYDAFAHGLFPLFRHANRLEIGETEGLIQASGNPNLFNELPFPV